MNSKIREEVGDTEEKGTLAPSGLVPALFTLQGCPHEGHQFFRQGAAPNVPQSTYQLVN